MATIPSLPSRDDVLRMARNTTDITGQLLDTAGNITRIALNTFDPRDGSGSEVLRVLRETTAAAATAQAVRPVLIAGEELLVFGLEHLQPLFLTTASRAGRLARAAAIRVSAAVSPAAERGVVVAVSPA